MTRATLNILDNPKVDRRAFAERYRVFGCEAPDFRMREDVCDTIRGTAGVLSLLNDGDGKTVRILADTGPKTRTAVVESFAGSDARTRAALKELNPESLDDRTLIRLLMNSMSSLDKDVGDTMSNASGWYARVIDMRGKRDDPDQIIALMFDIRPAYNGTLMLSCNVVSFTNIRLKDGPGPHMEFSKNHPFERYAQYALVDNRIVRAPKGWDGPRFIRRGLHEYGKVRRNTVDFLDVNSEMELYGSRAGVTKMILDSMKRRFQDIVDIRLMDTEVNRTRIQKRFDDNWQRMMDILSDGVSVMDMAGDPLRMSVLVTTLEAMGIHIHTPESPGFGANVLYLVGKKGSDDDRYGTDDYNTTQHIMVENVPTVAPAIKTEKGKGKRSGFQTLLESALKELAIKRDATDGIVRMFDWPSLGIETEAEFALPSKGEDGEKDGGVCILTVHPDGTFDSRHLHFFDVPPWAADLIEPEKECAIRIGEDAMLIERTDITPIPDVEGIREIMRDNRAAGRNESYGLKGKDASDTVMVEVTDINWTRVSDTEALYYVGNFDTGNTGKFPWASTVRRATAVKGNLFMDRIADMMDVTFVRYRMPTVLPFPVKYLRESIPGCRDRDEN